MPDSDPRSWSVDQVAAFLTALDLDQYAPKIRAEKVDGSTLVECGREDLVQLGLMGIHADEIVDSFLSGQL